MTAALRTETTTVDRLMSTEETSFRVGVSNGTLRNWRAQGRGPAFVRLGRSIRYRESDVSAFIERLK